MRTIFPTTRNHYSHGAGALGASMTGVESQLSARRYPSLSNEWEHQQSGVAQPLTLPCGILKVRALGEKDKASFKARVSFGDVSVRRDEAATMWGSRLGILSSVNEKNILVGVVQSPRWNALWSALDC